MPPQELIRKLRISRGIITNVEGRSFLHGKRVSDHNLLVLKWLLPISYQEVTLIMEINNKRVDKKSKMGGFVWEAKERDVEVDYWRKVTKSYLATWLHVIYIRETTRDHWLLRDLDTWRSFGHLIGWIL